VSRYIKIIEVELNVPNAIALARAAGMNIRFKESEREEQRTMLISTVDFLSGPNPWGYHNDMRFGRPNSAIRAGSRVMDAAEQAAEQKGEYVELADADWEQVNGAIKEPQPHPNTIPMPPAISRAILPITEAIENAGGELLDEAEKSEEAPPDAPDPDAIEQPPPEA